MSKKLRLDKYLADMKIGTRSEVKTYIRKGKIKVNGRTATAAGFKIDVEADEVTFEDKIVSYTSFEYYMFHKPAGCVSATEDRDHKTVLDYIDGNRRDLFPVGRLDIDTEGLLLITNDGKLAHDLLSPKKHVKKTYYAKIKGVMTNEDKRRLEEGVDIGEEHLTLPAELEILTADEISEIKITITEGKYHQVKRMFTAVGKEVLYLRRLSMGSLKLDEALKAGAYRTLTEEEIQQLQNLNEKG